MTDVITVQLVHDFEPNSNPYVDEVELVLDRLKANGLAERGWDNSGQPGIIRHETGPEIVLAVAAVAQLATALVDLFKASKKQHPESKVTIVAADPETLKAALAGLAK